MHHELQGQTTSSPHPNKPDQISNELTELSFLLIFSLLFSVNFSAQPIQDVAIIILTHQMNQGQRKEQPIQ